MIYCENDGKYCCMVWISVITSLWFFGCSWQCHTHPIDFKSSSWRLGITVEKAGVVNRGDQASVNSQLLSDLACGTSCSDRLLDSIIDQAVKQSNFRDDGSSRFSNQRLSLTHTPSTADNSSHCRFGDLHDQEDITHPIVANYGFDLFYRKLHCLSGNQSLI